MEAKTCETCSSVFVPEEGYDYTRLCMPCWKKSKGYALTKSDNELVRLQTYLDDRVGALEKALAEANAEAEEAKRKAEKSAKSKKTDAKANELTPARIKALIRLVHPDKHGNSELATEMTKWLLNLRGK